jgi:diaminohydroxyphosphoribosylaminopyrimidine deaminase/5-amino-6-(5-phosphoribosylamino)uracil reductase
MQRLREAGIAADFLPHVPSEEVDMMWLSATRRGWPYVILKAATTAEGSSAPLEGPSAWITGAESRHFGHWLRAQCSAILIGWRTVALDQPKLTARYPGVVNPITRVILDPRQQLTELGGPWDEPGPVLRLTHCEPAEVLAELWRQGLTSVLVEGGPTTISHFLRAGLFDEVHWFQAPVAWENGRHWTGGGPTDEIRWVSESQLGADTHRIGLHRRWGTSRLRPPSYMGTDFFLPRS